MTGGAFWLSCAIFFFLGASVALWIDRWLEIREQRKAKKRSA